MPCIIIVVVVTPCSLAIQLRLAAPCLSSLRRRSLLLFFSVAAPQIHFIVIIIIIVFVNFAFLSIKVFFYFPTELS